MGPSPDTGALLLHRWLVMISLVSTIEQSSSSLTSSAPATIVTTSQQVLLGSSSGIQPMFVKKLKTVKIKQIFHNQEPVSIIQLRRHNYLRPAPPD